MKLDAFLCNYAEIKDGLLTLVGAGVTHYRGNPPAIYLAGRIDVPWDQTNLDHVFKVELLNPDGESVTPGGFSEPLVGEMHFQMGRPPGAKPGTSFAIPFVFPFFGLQLPTGQYILQLSINGDTKDDWPLVFYAEMPPLPVPPAS
jgi:hypothetical protein